MSVALLQFYPPFQTDSNFQVAANDAWGKVYTRDGTLPMTQGISVLTGMSAGATESLIVTPFEGVKIMVRPSRVVYAHAPRPLRD